MNIGHFTKKKFYVSDFEKAKRLIQLLKLEKYVKKYKTFTVEFWDITVVFDCKFGSSFRES